MDNYKKKAFLIWAMICVALIAVLSCFCMVSEAEAAYALLNVEKPKLFEYSTTANLTATFLLVFFLF